jgi:hypothetical protein
MPDLRDVLVASTIGLAAMVCADSAKAAQSREAVITSRTFKSGETYTQIPIGTDRGFRSPTNIPIAESYTFELKLDGVAEPVRASFNSVKSRQFEVGQRVRVEYTYRGIPPFWRRIVVTDMQPVEVR